LRASKKRIAILIYQKFPKDDWPAEQNRLIPIFCRSGGPKLARVQPDGPNLALVCVEVRTVRKPFLLESAVGGVIVIEAAASLAQTSAEGLLDLAAYVPAGLLEQVSDQTSIPRIAKDAALTDAIERSLSLVPTTQNLWNADSRDLSFLADESVHLVLTSPPYWTLKEYNVSEGQMGFIADYDEFLRELDRVWRECYRVLVPGGRLICVVGDVCLSRRRNGGEHTVVPLHASIQEHCRDIGFNNLAPIIWYKIANAVFEASGNGGGFLGKPYEPNGVIKNDIEFILMQRKPGGYRTPSPAARILSVIPSDRHKDWFQQIWSGLTGASTRNHPAPYPLELAERLIRMFSFAGDTVLDPFMGTASTNLAASRWGRNSIGVEIDPHYFQMSVERVHEAAPRLLRSCTVEVHRAV
jgi:DNA modification methylase